MRVVMSKSLSRFGLALCLLPVIDYCRAADWPQWRGPDRTNVSRETGLLAEWPKDGPALAWKATGIGDGITPPAVLGGRVFVTGQRDGDEYCTALSEKDGKQLWTAKLGPAAKESSLMRWLAQLTPTVETERVYAVTSNGDYVCLATETGKEIWRKHFVTDFGGKKGSWGFCDYPLVDGDRLIICPGGEKNTVAALNKKTGELVWSCPIPNEAAAHSVLVQANMHGQKQYVVQLRLGMYGISTDGKLLWKYTELANGTANTHAPIVRENDVFYANGYGKGHALIKLTKKDDQWTVEEVHRGKGQYVPWLGSPTAVGEHLFVNAPGMMCMEWKTGKVTWQEDKVPGRCMYVVAGGMLFIRTQTGKMLLAAADPQELKVTSEFKPPRPDMGQPAWTFPVVANGRLYIREYDTILCYDVHDPEQPRKKVPDAVFVPTPPDVVTKMLELAGVKKDDVVYDLGSGDGRIVIAAAKTHGCKAMGVELDKELVVKSRTLAKDAGVEKLATFECGDLFESDFSSATVVALYILPTMSKKLIPQFEKLKPGSRIVSHCFAIPGVIPDKVIKVTSEEDDVERPVYLYVIPLKHKKADR
jgi:outer membrane protein assembly factor BamB